MFIANKQKAIMINVDSIEEIRAEIENLIATGQTISYELLQSYNFIVGNQQSEENQE